MLTFCGAKIKLEKVQALIKKVAVFSATKDPVTASEAEIPCKKIKIEPTDQEVIIDCGDDDGFQDEAVTKWICINNFTLSRTDKDHS